MDYKNIANYYSSISIVLSMLGRGLISRDDAIKSEKFLADRYCIKIDSIYRLIDLIKDEERVMYSNGKKV